MKQAIAIAVALAATAMLAAPVKPAAAGAGPYLQLAQNARQLNAQELGRVQSGAPPMPPMAASEPPAECPPGTRFVAGGYGKHAKWRPAGCYAR